ncbi:hypothetical protein HYPSUDRAFT_656912 [Hypholoma sublateritium FD-334 SS-4]|uniref:Heterokaryon incompatibility domain-containing protein n=1 Tax=Hypholoma sublateritium (strain FD-334 SS-4) TaxID=945553 RepID=A0A0D2P134_HYPSF|nr:hypothetical protein HYPSUDRAFT_656912 [Hypholoma sublateritium FD-334 SS-4]
MTVISTSANAFNVHHADLSTSAQARTLLDALVGFIHPVVDVYTSPRNLSGPQYHNAGPRGMGMGNEGKELLIALERFIVATIAPRSVGEVVKWSHPSRKRAMGPDHKIFAKFYPAVRPREIQCRSLASSAREEARRIVYNEMPIRMLTFDDTGSRQVLLERNQVLNLILRRASIEASTWVFANTEEVYEEVARVHAKLVHAASRYAILSHTWIRDEPGDVVFQDWAERERNERGYAKIARFCQAAAQDHGVVFGWMDTVCINKESSSELDESIRSMLKWYRNSWACVAYLSETTDIADMHADTWFTRGWTLQELLAPHNTCFYNRHWEWLAPERAVGWAPRSPIWAHIEKATTIAPAEFRELRWRCRARREPGDSALFSRTMQLAARRTVTREEDQVYSIMGLLNVEISIAYGEGAKRALRRLLREYMASTPHVLDVFNHSYAGEGRLLTSDIKDYLSCSTLVANDFNCIRWKSAEPILYTHLGVCLSLLLVPALKQKEARRQQPTGQYSGDVSLVVNEDYASYTLLDRKIYASGSLNIWDMDALLPDVVILGIVNFVVDRDIIRIHAKSFSIPLCNAAWDESRTRDYDVRVIRVTQPVVCNIWDHTRPDSDSFVIPIDELERHGMRISKIYLP